MPEHQPNVIEGRPVGAWKVFIPILRVADEKPEVFCQVLDLSW